MLKERRKNIILWLFLKRHSGILASISFYFEWIIKLTRESGWMPLITCSFSPHSPKSLMFSSGNVMILSSIAVEDRSVILRCKLHVSNLLLCFLGWKLYLYLGYQISANFFTMSLCCTSFPKSPLAHSVSLMRSKVAFWNS